MNLPAEWWPSLGMAGLLMLESGLIVAATVLLETTGRSATWRRTLWHAALLAFCLSFAVEFSGLSREALGWLRKPSLPANPHRAVLAPTAPVLRATPSMVSPVPRPVTLNPQVGRPAVPASVVPLSLKLSKTAVVRSTRRARPLAQAVGSVEPFLTGRVLPWPQMVWAAGILAALGPVVLARLCFVLFRLGRHPTSDPELLERANRLARRLNVRRVRVLESSALSGPIAFGVLRPAVGLPADFSRRFSPAQQEVMLAHELAHVVGHDPAWNALADLVTTIFWWNPMVWWARSRLRAAAEAAADEASLLVADGPGVLAECLFELAARAIPREARVGLGVTGRGFRSELGRRIERLLRLKGEGWSPIRPLQNAAVKLTVPLILVVATLLCTAWAGRQTMEEPMKDIRYTWKRSLATLALFAAVGAGAPEAPAAVSNSAPAAPTENATAPAPTPNHTDTEAQKALMKRYGISAPASEASPATSSATPSPATQATPPPGENAAPSPAPQPLYQMDPRLLRRYGLMPNHAPAASVSTNAKPNRGKQQVEARLNQIQLNEVNYAGIPLEEVVRDLNDQARRRDPDKKGINFLISNVPETPFNSGSIDPTTGQPIPAVSSSEEIGGVPIKLRLQDVSLHELLDALVRVTQPPIIYSVQDYGVVFSPGPGAPAVREYPLLQVRTFRVNTNTFLAGLESTFGIKVPTTKAPATDSAALLPAEAKLKRAQAEMRRAQQLADAKALDETALEKAKADVVLAESELKALQDSKARAVAVSPRELQRALQQLLQQLGIDMGGNKAVFYNDLTGILMVRATGDDLQLVQAAVETLGGRSLVLNP